ncbi:MAG: hypothetical protein Q8L73_00770 [Methylotenera sp.]|nr:hypothetical protein [Methylotenera sp.]
MIELTHYSTFEDQEEFISKFTNKYSLVIQASSMDIDDRTKWTGKFLNDKSEKILSVQFDVVTCSLKVNGKQIKIREFEQNLEHPNSKPLIDATSLEYPEIQYLFYWLHSIQCPFDVLYVEPKHYTSKKVMSKPLVDFEFALSEDGPGVLQLPPFIGSTRNETINVISMGFEGHRVAGLLNNDQLQDPGFDDVRVVIGIPAFKAGFDQISLKYNSIALKQIQKLPRREAIFAAANNPYSMTAFLEQLQKSIRPENEGVPLRNINLIPFGTKPAAIGMAWFAVKHQDNTVVTYDHIKKLPGRSEGVGRIHFAQFTKI